MTARPFAAALATLLLTLAAPACSGPVTDRIYPAPKEALSLDGLPAGSRLIDVRTADGLPLKGIALTARTGKPTLLVFHGNGSSAATTMRWFAPLTAHGYGIVAAEYRGYSANPGKPSEPGLAADADAFYAFARTATPGRLIVVGHSLGGGVALGLSRRQTLEGLVTIGTFTQLRELVPKIARAFVSDRYDNLGAVAALDEPYFLIHGTSDDVIPWKMGEALHDAAGSAHRSGASFIILGAGHAPAGDQVAAVIETVARTLDGATLDAAGLPKEIKLVPFGQSKPLNP